MGFIVPSEGDSYVILSHDSASERPYQALRKRLHQALATARDCGARVILLYVKPPQETVIGEFGSMPPEPEPTAEANLRALQSLAPADAKVKAECLVVEGNPVDQILRVAQEYKCDLIVLGYHPHSWLGRLLTVDVVDKVSHKAQCPVVTVRSPG
jgi:nucleotide-binding universal stress UspA family protein